MPTFIITPSRHEKPLPALPSHDGYFKRASLLVQADDSSIYSYESSAPSSRNYSHIRRQIEHRRDSQSSMGASHTSLIPSILKSRSTESKSGRRKAHGKVVRFMPIIDGLLRHALHSRCIAHDLRFPPHSARIPSPMGYKVFGALSGGHYMPFCKKTRAQSAISPPVDRMWIVSYEFPWVIEVNGTATSIPDAESHRFITSGRDRHDTTETFVTIYDVLHTLWANLQRPVLEPEWSSLSPSRRRSIRRTCTAAYAHEPSRSQADSTSSSRNGKKFDIKPSSGTRRVVRRIDWLGRSTRFGGLGKDDALITERVKEIWRRELTWVLVLDDNEYRYEDVSSQD